VNTTLAARVHAVISQLHVPTSTVLFTSTLTMSPAQSDKSSQMCSRNRLLYFLKNDLICIILSFSVRLFRIGHIQWHNNKLDMKEMVFAVTKFRKRLLSVVAGILLLFWWENFRHIMCQHTKHPEGLQQSD